MEELLLNESLNNLKECEFKDAIIPMGKDDKGNLIWENFKNLNNIFITGSTGSGKTIFIKDIVLSLLKQLNSNKVKYVFIDPKYIELTEFKINKYCYTNDIDNANNIIQNLLDEMEKRYSLFTEVNVKNIEEFNTINQNKLKHIVVIIDEFIDMIFNHSEFYENMFILLRKCRASGIHLIVSTQYPTLNQYKDLINNFTTKITFNLSSKETSEIVIGSNEAIKLKNHGEAIISLPNKQYKVLVPYISDEEIENIMMNNNNENELQNDTEDIEEKQLCCVSIPKLVLINLTDNDLNNRLSEYINLYNYNELNNEGDIIKDTDFICILYNDENELENEAVKHIIDLAKEKEIDIFYSNKNKTIEENIDIFKAISSLICEPAVINIESQDIKGYDIVDAFVLENKDFVKLKEEYINTFVKFTKDIENISQVVLSITGGIEARLDEIFELVDIIRNKVPKNIDIIFGSGIDESYSGIQKVCVIFQGGGKRALKKKLLEDKLQTAHENFINSDYMKIKPIDDEVYDKDFYKTQIEKFCKLDRISISTIQRYFSIGFPKACQICDEWENKGYLVKSENTRKIVNERAIFSDLMEIFKDKM